MLILTPPIAALLLMPGSSLQRASPHPRLRSVSRCCSRARVPLLSEESDARMAAQAVAWFDEVSMLQVFYMGDLRHDAGAADADAIEAAIVASGGNVSSSTRTQLDSKFIQEEATAAFISRRCFSDAFSSGVDLLIAIYTLSFFHL